jgi:hypothetical protein
MALSCYNYDEITLDSTNVGIWSALTNFDQFRRYPYVGFRLALGWH